jgi:hypothetical protein
MFRNGSLEHDHETCGGSGRVEGDRRVILARQVEFGCTESYYVVETAMDSPPGFHYHEDRGDCSDEHLYALFVATPVQEETD